jgi:PAS domain S-box-containing protein
MNRPRRITASLIILIISLWLAACQPQPHNASPASTEAAWGSILLTAEEEHWLETHPTVEIYMENWPPFIIFEEDQVSGISIDILNQLCEQVGLEPVYKQGDWLEVMQNMQNNTGAEIAPAVVQSPAREDMMYLTDSYLTFPLVIYNQKNAVFISDINDLKGQTIAVENSYVSHITLINEYPEINLLVTKTTLEALEAVSTSKADAYIGNLAVSSYLIQQHGLVNLKVAAPAPFEDNVVSFGIRRDRPELASILNKALAAMPRENLIQIQQEWLSIRYEYGISQQDMLLRIAMIVLISLLILGIVIYSNRRLSAEMDEKEATRLALQESENLLRTVIDATPDLIFVKDREGKYLLVNKAGAEMYNMTPKQMQGHYVTDLIEMAGASPKEIERFKATDQKVIQQKSIVVVPDDASIDDKQNTQWFHTTKIPLETEGEVNRILVISTDVTDRKNTMEVLKQERASLTQHVEERTAELVRLNIELQESSRAKDEFLANMSHELRTPLNAILGMSEILQEKLFGELNEKQLKQVVVIEESGRHLLALINDILDLAKIESGQSKLEYEPVNITDLCKSSLNFINSQALKKSISVSFEPLAELSEIEADPRSLKQVLVNLLSNAVKFTPEKGQIGLRVDQNAQTETVCLTVWDTGIGITPEQSLKLFKPFVQIDSSLARNYEGTGLGLSLISRLVDMHGGSVRLESSGIHGDGSHFTIHLPFHPTAFQTDLQPEFEGTRALLMDDEANSRQRMQSILNKLGCQVLLAETNLDAIHIAQEMQPELIFIDTQIPQESSLQAIRQIRQEMGKDSIPILCLTSLMIQKDPALSDSFGTYEYLLKPVSPKAVRHLLEKYLREDKA